MCWRLGHGRWANCCNQHLCTSVRLFVCLSVHSQISKTTRPNFTKFSVNVTCGVAVVQSYSDENAACYVLPVLWMTSCFHIMEPMGQNKARGNDITTKRRQQIYADHTLSTNESILFLSMSTLRKVPLQHSLQENSHSNYAVFCVRFCFCLYLCFSASLFYWCNRFLVNKYVSPPYRRAEMYAGRVACCPLLSHGEYADGTDRQTDGQTDRRQTVTLHFPLVIKPTCFAYPAHHRLTFSIWTISTWTTTWASSSEQLGFCF